jgi:hypothetical protein
MPKRLHGIILMFAAMPVLTGCTMRAWYEGLQSSAAQACQTQPSSERMRCEARLNKQDYDSYEKQRKSQ